MGDMISRVLTECCLSRDLRVREHTHGVYRCVLMCVCVMIYCRIGKVVTEPESKLKTSFRSFTSTPDPKRRRAFRDTTVRRRRPPPPVLLCHLFVSVTCFCPHSSSTCSCWLISRPSLTAFCSSDVTTETISMIPNGSRRTCDVESFRLEDWLTILITDWSHDRCDRGRSCVLSDWVCRVVLFRVGVPHGSLWICCCTRDFDLDLMKWSVIEGVFVINPVSIIKSDFWRDYRIIELIHLKIRLIDSWVAAALVSIVLITNISGEFWGSAVLQRCEEMHTHSSSSVSSSIHPSSNTSCQGIPQRGHFLFKLSLQSSQDLRLLILMVDLCSLSFRRQTSTRTVVQLF